MILFFAIVISVLFGAGAYMLLKRDLIRMIVGMILVGNAANLFIMSSALQRGSAAILPLKPQSADPLVQALVLTAVVISFATSTLALVLVYRVYTSHYSMDLSRLETAEVAESERLEPKSDDLIEQANDDDTDGHVTDTGVPKEGTP